MPPLADAEVRALAHLARLELDDATVARLADELAAHLAYVAMLDELDPTAVEPMTHAVAMTLRLRDDLPGPALTVDDALAGAAATRDGCFEVPAVID